MGDRFSLKPGVVLQPMAGGAVLLDGDTGDCFELNQTACELWTSLAAGREVTEIVDSIAAHYGKDRETVWADAQALIDTLVGRQILSRAG